MENPVEALVVSGVEWLTLAVETLGAITVAIGVLVAAYEFITALAAREPAKFNHIRLSFARYLALALEFQLAADILSTAVAPSWDQIGKLAAVAVIRTLLNFFLMRELEQAGLEKK